MNNNLPRDLHEFINLRENPYRQVVGQTVTRRYNEVPRRFSLARSLSLFPHIERHPGTDGISFAQPFRILSGPVGFIGRPLLGYARYLRSRGTSLIKVSPKSIAQVRRYTSALRTGFVIVNAIDFNDYTDSSNSLRMTKRMRPLACGS